MTASNEPAAVTTPGATPQATFECVTCHATRPHSHFGRMRGKRNPECLVCGRARYTRNRRARLVLRRCLSCKQLRPFEAFPAMPRGDGRERLGMRCIACVARAEAMTGGRPSRIPRARRTGQVIDLSAVAQELVYPGVAYTSLDLLGRGRVYAVTRELARRYSPTWDDRFDGRPSPEELTRRAWAQHFLSRATLPAIFAQLDPNPGTMPAAVAPDIAPAEPLSDEAAA